MAGVTIRYDGDPDGALDASEQVQDGLADVEAGLDGLGDAAQQAGRDVADGLGEASDAAGEATEGLEDVSEGAGGAGLNARSMGSVFKQVLEGDVAGAARAAVPLLSALGPAAAIAGVAAFAGLSLIQEAINNSSGAAKVGAEDAATWAQAWIDAGGSVITSQQLVAEVLAISTDPERYEQAKKNAEDWGVTVSTAMRAMAGDALALTAAQASLNERSAEAARLLAEQEVQVDANAGAAYDLDEATRRGGASLDALYAAMQAGKEIASETSDALLDIVRASGEASLEVDKLGNQLYTLPDGTKVVVDAETGQASQNVETFKGDLDGIAETVTTSVDLDLPDAAAAIRQMQKDFWGRRVVVKASLVTPYGREIV
jgi:hypothetical protein